MNISAPSYKNDIVYADGVNADIIETIEKNYPAAKYQAIEFCRYFKGKTAKETARNIYSFLRRDIRYVKDSSVNQNIKLPRRFYADKTGDCKSFSLFTAGILGACKMPVIFRYAGYKKNATQPSHVYVVTKDEHGNELIIDGVYGQFNEEAPYVFKKDHTMQINVLSGLNNLQSQIPHILPSRKLRPRKVITLEELLLQTRPGSFEHALVQNRLYAKQKREITNYAPSQLAFYRRILFNALSKTKRATYQRMINHEIADIDNNKFRGIIPAMFRSEQIAGLQESIGFSFKHNPFNRTGKQLKHLAKQISIENAKKAIKAVAFVVPRKAFLALVALNVRGLAARLSKLSRNKLRLFWERFGGSPHTIEVAVEVGKYRKPLLGGGRISKTASGIRGLEIMDESMGVVETAAAASTGTAAASTIGVAPAAVAAIIASAGPILIAVIKLFKKEGIPEPPGVNDTNVINETKEGGGRNVWDNIKDFGKNVLDQVQSTGIIPDKPLTPTEASVDAALPGNDLEQPQSTDMTTKLLIGGVLVGGLLLLTSKKHKK